MPMYFILSGYISHPKETSLKKYTKQKAYELLLPAVVFIIATLPLYFFLMRDSSYSVFEHMKKVFFVNGIVAYNDPIWFLIVFFQVTILFYLIRGHSLSRIGKIAVSVSLLVCGYLVYSFSVPLPFGLDKTIICLAFYVIGSLMRDLHKAISKKYFPAIISTSAVVWFVCGVILNDKVSLYYMDLGNYWLFIVSGITGSLFWFGICLILRKAAVFQKWGQNTMLVICTQYVGVSAVKYIASHIGILHTVYYDFLALAISFLAMFLYMPICSLFNRYLPFLVGKRRKEKYAKDCVGQSI